MNQLFSQFRRIMSDDGRGDRDFSKQEYRLREAQRALREATESLTRAAELLQGELLLHDHLPTDLH